MKLLFKTGLAAILFLTLTACGGRVPSTKSAHSLTQHHFERYGKKYKTSLFAKDPIDKIEINDVREQSLHVADIDAVLTFKSGTLARVLLTAKTTPPLGWKVTSWEMLGMR
ncbi:hypothetical protein K1X76_00260 [bacterium]|nr:hypothetical protein [bacterium]